MAEKNDIEIVKVQKDDQGNVRSLKIKKGSVQWDLFMGQSVLKFVLFMILSPIFAFIISLIAASSREAEVINSFLLFFYIFYGVYLIYFQCDSVYKVWKFTQLSETFGNKPTPAAAVGFLFIPIFNLYWIFIAFGGPRKHLTDIIKRHTNKHYDMGGIGTAVAVVSLIPIVQILNVVLIPILFAKWREAESIILKSLIEEKDKEKDGRKVYRNPSLEFYYGEFAGNTLPLNPNEEIIIGREPLKAKIVLDHEQVSRTHLSIRFDSQRGKFILRDLNSTHGVFVNGMKIEKGSRSAVNPGSRVELGKKAAGFIVKTEKRNI